MLRRKGRQTTRQEREAQENNKTAAEKLSRASQRPAVADPAQHRDRPRGTTRNKASQNPGPLTRGGRACLSLCPVEAYTPFPGAFFPRHHRQRRPVGGARGERGTTSPARPQAPERTSWSAPGAPTEGQGERAPARPTGEARAARRRDAPSPPRGGAAPQRRSREGQRGECPLRHRDHGA